MGKFKMPSEQEFLKRKYIYGPIKDPVWVYLEREMRENAERKPYNTRVSNWLLFLKSLRYHYYCEAKANYNRLVNESGPPWYLEFSKEQREILYGLKAKIHEDVLEDLTTRVRKALRDLGITAKMSHNMLMTAMLESKEDPGIFIWILYRKIYKVQPSELRTYYDLNAMLLMSALVFIDLDECMEVLDKITQGETTPPSPVQKKKPSYYEPKVKYGEYLQRMRIPVYSTHPATLPKPKKPIPFSSANLQLRSAESYERLKTSTLFLELRKRRNMKVLMDERKCKYKFWEPPASLRNTDPTMAAFVLKMRMLKLKPKKNHLKFKAPYENVQFLVASVSYMGGKPIFHLATAITLDTGSTPIHGGRIKFRTEYITHIVGMWKPYKPNRDKCDKTCDCQRWTSTVYKHLDDTQCQCRHYYDLESSVPTAVSKNTYFHPPTRYMPFLFDHAKIYQLDLQSEFTYEELINAMESETGQTTVSQPELSFANLSGKQVLEVLFANISETPLIIPHLPKANHLNCLLEWVRRRMHGSLTPAQHKQLMLISQRRWLDLSHIDFRAKAYCIPFTLKQLAHLNWSHRKMIQNLFNILVRNFEARTRKYQLEQTRLWWPTMAYDCYPNKAFLDVFFTYMPCRYQDTLVLDPYCAAHYIAVTSRPCPLAERDIP